MNAPSSMTRQLVRKECRQLLPLVLTLFGVGIGMILLWQMMPSDSRELKELGRYVPLAIPALFAVGAAAILVSQEREQKTIWWMMSMPIEPERLFRTKLLVAIGMLAAIWIACWLLIRLEVAIGLFPGGSFQYPFVSGYSESFWQDTIFWHLHSLFLMLCGFYASWRIKNSIASLIAIVPLAFAPFLLIQCGYALWRRASGFRYVDTSVSSWLTLGVTAIGCGILVWLARRAALRELSPAEPPRVDRDRSGNTRAAVFDYFRPPTSSSRPVPATPLGSPVITLFWQSLNHNRVALYAIVGMIMLTSAALASANISSVSSRSYVSSHVSIMFCGYLATCWLGVLAFTGDGSSKRMRFFADRGVSPAKLWLGRQLLGLTVLSSAALLFIAVAMIDRTIDWEASSNSIMLLPPLAIAIVCYVISQWVSHVFQTLPAAIILAPIAVGSLATIAFMLIPQSTLAGSHVMTVVVSLPILVLFPLLATFVTMRLFADGARTRRFYGLTACLFAVWVSITLIPAGLAYRDFPRTTRQQQRSLAQQAADAISPAPRLPSPLAVRFPSLSLEMNGTSPTEQLAVEIYQARDFSPRELVWMTFPADRGLYIDQHSFSQLYAEANFALQRFKASSGQDDEFDEWVSIMTSIAAQFRKSWRLQEQAFADITEHWLVRVLESDAYKSRVQSEPAQSAIALVTDQAGRLTARRRSILISWAHYDENRQKEESNHTFGGYSHYACFGWLRGALDVFLFQDAIVDSIAIHSLALIDAGSSGKPTRESRQALSLLINGVSRDFESGGYGDRLRADGASQTIMASGQVANQLPMSQWFAAWEDDAMKLSDQVVPADSSDAPAPTDAPRASGARDVTAPPPSAD